MKERGGEQNIHGENFTNHLRRFFDDSPEVTAEAIQAQTHEEPQISKAELFRRLTSYKGRGKSHVSRFTADTYDGKLKRS